MKKPLPDGLHFDYKKESIPLANINEHSINKENGVISPNEDLAISPFTVKIKFLNNDQEIGVGTLATEKDFGPGADY